MMSQISDSVTFIVRNEESLSIFQHNAKVITDNMIKLALYLTVILHHSRRNGITSYKDWFQLGILGSLQYADEVDIILQRVLTYLLKYFLVS